MPSFTRSGRPPASCSASLPSGSTSTALRVRSAIWRMLDCRLRSAVLATSSPHLFDGGPRNKAPAAWRRSSARPSGSPDQARETQAEEAARALRAARARCPRPGLDGLRDDGGGLPGPAGDLQLRRVQSLEEQRGRWRQRRTDRHPDQRSEQNPAQLLADLSQRQERGGLDRGLALLRTQRRRLSGHRPRPGQGRAQPERPAGRLDDHRAVRQERARSRRQPHDPGEVPRGGAGLQTRAPLDQGQDPHRVPEHDLLRRGRLRDRGRRPHLLRRLPSRLWHPDRALRLGPGAVGGGDPGGDHRLALGLRPQGLPGKLTGPPQPGAGKDVRTGLHLPRPAGGRDQAGAALAQSTSNRPSSNPRPPTSPPTCASSWSNATAPRRRSSAASRSSRPSTCSCRKRPKKRSTPTSATRRRPPRWS